MSADLNLLMFLGSVGGDGLGGYISKSPYHTGADDLRLNWVHSQAILVPFPQLQHFPADTQRNSRQGKRKIL